MNKKLFSLLPVLAAFTLTVKAQTQKGSHLLGGNISADYNKSTTVNGNYGQEDFYKYSKSTTALGIGPTYSYFIKDNLDLGATGVYSWQNDSYDVSVPGEYYTPENKGRYTAVLGGLYLRKYFLYNNKIGFRAGPFIQYQEQRSKTYYTSAAPERYKTQYFNLGLGLDFVYFPTSKIGLTASMGDVAYNSVRRVQGRLVEQSDGVGLGFFTNGLNLSIIFALGK